MQQPNEAAVTLGLSSAFTNDADFASNTSLEASTRTGGPQAKSKFDFKLENVQFHSAPKEGHATLTIFHFVSMPWY
jgi:hypothetical protein